MGTGVATGDVLMDGLSPDEKFRLLGELFLDAREWRAEEADLLIAYQEELRRTREELYRLITELGEKPPQPRTLPKPKKPGSQAIVRRYRPRLTI